MVGLVREESVKEFFFKGALQGYAGAGAKIPVPEMPGYKTILFSEGDFSMREMYCVNEPTGKSAGTKTIWFQDMPVWFMSFCGLYDKRAIPTLKSALKRAYDAKEFMGGRGVNLQGVKTPYGRMSYHNHPVYNTFEKFEGREEMLLTDTGDFLGYHEYMGMKLL
jgi:hypothetical protein